MRRFSFLPVLLLFEAASPNGRPPTTVLVVSVGNVATGGFIENAQVRLPSVGRIALTGWNGEAQFAGLTPGKYHVQVRALGYAPGDVDIFASGDTADVVFQLEHLTATLDTVRVVAKQVARGLKEFEARRTQNIGRFFTDSALIEHRAQGLQMLLATGTPGLSVNGKSVVSQSGSMNGRSPKCSVLFYLDGFQLGQSLPARGAFEREPINLDAMRLEDLAGIEVYSRVEAPPQYRPLGDYCKVILLWTKWETEK